MQLTFQACADLNDIWDSIAMPGDLWGSTNSGHLAAARGFAEKPEQLCHLMTLHPETGPRRDMQQEGVRSLLFQGCVMFCRVRGNCLEVMRVLRATRELDAVVQGGEVVMAKLRISGIEACVFDAYGTLFDVASAAAHARDELGDAWQPLADLWRLKQLQYTWLRALMGRHADFWRVTGDALDYALASMKRGEPALRERLMELYLSLDAYPEVESTLARLKAGGMKLAILSNGTPAMLAAACKSSRLADMFDALLSVESVGVYKPHPSVYRLAVDHFALPPDRMCFLSSNSWDAHAAKANGYRVLWCNRFDQAPERIPEAPDGEIASLAELPEIVGC